MHYFYLVKLKSRRFIILHGRAICLGILCVFFVAPVVFAQSQSATETIIEKIYQSELRVREHVDKKVEGIETKISAVDTKVDNLSTTVGTLSADVRENKTNIANMKDDIRELKGAVDRIWYGILGVLGTLILSIAGYFFKSWREGQGKADNVDVVDGLADQITKLTSAQVEISDQIVKLTSAQTEILERISAQAAISETRDLSGHPKVPIADELDGLTDDTRSQQRGTGERV